MHFLDKSAETVFHTLIEGLKKPGDAKKIDNTNGTIRRNEKFQQSLADFATMWMMNIKDQQRI